MFLLGLGAASLDAQLAQPLELRLTVNRVDDALQMSVGAVELGDVGPFAFHPPLDARDRSDLRWYLEESWRWPIGPDEVRADRVEQKIGGIGQRLFEAVFDSRQAGELWQSFWTAGDRPRLLTVDSEDPEVLRLPWELLSHPQHGFLFASDIAIRRRLRQPIRAAEQQFNLPLRILMVVARPRGLPFIDARASSQAVMQGVEELGTENVVVEFLHPSTLTALDRRLRDKRQPRVHVVHFDGHGVYQFEEGEGLGVLAFEDADGGLDHVGADRLATLVKQVPLFVLDACQSAYADAPDPYSSVAPRLIRSGVGNVVAMQYSVLVETSRRFFAEFYRTLATGQTIGQAMDAGRRDLLGDTKRLEIVHPEHGEIDVELLDWFLPVLYQQNRDPAPFVGAVAAEAPSAEKPERLLGGFPVPKYRFVGRSRELWDLEEALREKRIVVVHGLAGQGKTALASEAARWFTRKGLFARAVFVSFEEGAERDSVVAEMGRLLADEEFAALGREEQLPALREALAEAPTLLVWDNFESVLPGWEAQLDTEALAELLDLGEALTGDAATRLLITTRDFKIPHEAYAPSRTAARVELGEMQPSEALEFAGEILDTLDRPRPERDDLEQLLGFLGGHPLSIQLVMPHLQRSDNDVGKVIAEFEKLYEGFTEGEARKRNESLKVSLEFSINRLSDEVREHLPVLGVFQGRALDFAIPAVAEMDVETWNRIRGEFVGQLTQAGLLRVESVPWPAQAANELFEDEPDGEAPETVNVPFYRFHPTLSPYLRDQLSPEERGELEERYRGFYYAISSMLYQLDFRAPHQARAIARSELPNLRRAFELASASGDVDVAVVAFASQIGHFFQQLGRWREHDVLVARMEDVAKTASGGATGSVTKSQYLMESQRGEQALARKQGREAEGIFRDLLERMSLAMAYSGHSAEYDRAVTLGRLGRSLEFQGRAREAEVEYRRALKTLLGLDPENRLVQNSIGNVHSDLGDVLRQQGRYPEAREEYEKALEIPKMLGDQRAIAVTEGQLGTLALVQGDFAEARRRYKEALAAFRALNEPETEAIVQHQLGYVARREAGRASGERRMALLAEAEAAYRESLRLKESMGAWVAAAESALNLAVVAQGAGRFASAERWYRKALKYFEDEGHALNIAFASSNLAVLFLAVERLPLEERPEEFAERHLLDEADAWVRRSLEIEISIDDPSTEIWKTYFILAQIAEIRGDAAAVASWRQKEREAYVAFPGHWELRKEQWGPVVAVLALAAQGNEDVRGAIDELLDQLAETDDWRNLAAALRQVLAGERDAPKLASVHELDNVDYLILTRVLATLEAPADASAGDGDR